MKYGQQRLVAGRKNYIFFLCPLDGEQFTYGFPFFYLLQIDIFRVQRHGAEGLSAVDVELVEKFQALQSQIVHVAAEEIEPEVHRVAEHRDDDERDHVPRHRREHVEHLRDHAARKHQRHQSRVGQNVAEVARHVVIERAEHARELAPAFALHDGAEQHQRASDIQHRRTLAERQKRDADKHDPPRDLLEKGVEELFPLALFDQTDGHAGDDLHHAERHRADQDHRQIVERIEELRQREDRAGADDGDELREEIAEKSACQRAHDERADAAEAEQAEQLAARALGPVFFADDDRGDHHE